MSKVRMILLTLVLLTSLGGTARAGGDPLTKLGRGVENIVTSPLEFVTQYSAASEKNGVVTTFVTGTLKGVGMMGARILDGVYEIVTFPIPLPFHYAPLMNPETPSKALQRQENPKVKGHPISA